MTTVPKPLAPTMSGPSLPGRRLRTIAERALRARSVGNGPQDPCADGRRHVLALRPGARSAVQLPGRERGDDLGADPRTDRLSEDDPGGPGLGVHLPGHGPMGSPKRRHARLLSPGKTD